MECEKCQMIPFGQSAQYGQDQVVLFCPRCLDVYLPPLRRHHNIDGSAFGPTFLITFLKQYPELLKIQSKQELPHKLYGFQLFTNSHYDLRDYLSAKKDEKQIKQRNMRLKVDGEEEEKPKDAAENSSPSEGVPLGGLVPRTNKKKSTFDYLEGIPYPPLDVPSYFQKWADAKTGNTDTNGVPPIPVTATEFFVEYEKEKQTEAKDPSFPAH